MPLLENNQDPESSKDQKETPLLFLSFPIHRLETKCAAYSLAMELFYNLASTRNKPTSLRTR